MSFFLASSLPTSQSSSLVIRTTQITMSQQRALLVVERTASMFSIAASSFVLLSFVVSSRLRRRPFNRLLFLATWGNLFASVAAFIGDDGIKAGTKSAVCKAQGLLIQWFMPADSLWTFCMAVNVFLTFHTTTVHVDISRLEKWYFLVCYGIPAVPAFTYLLLDVIKSSDYYGDAILWCWIAEDHEILRIATFYAPVWVVIVVTMSLYAITGFLIYNGQTRIETISNLDGSNFSTSCNTRRVESLVTGTIAQVRKCTEIEQISEMVAEHTSSTMALNWAAVPSNEHSSGTHISHNDDDEHAKVKSVISPSITTIVTSTSATAVEDAQPTTPRHVPIVVPAFGNGISKPLFIPLEHIPPHFRLLNTNGVFSSSFSTTSTTRGRRVRPSSRSHAKSYARVAFALYIIMLVIWVPSTINRVYQLVKADKGSDGLDIPLNFAAACVLPLQGLFNAVIYAFVGRRDIAAEWRFFWMSFRTIFTSESKTADMDEHQRTAQGTDEEDIESQEVVQEIVHTAEEEEKMSEWPLKTNRRAERFDGFRIPSPTLRITAIS